MALDSLRASRSVLRRDLTGLSSASEEGSEGEEDAASEASLALSVTSTSTREGPGRMSAAVSPRWPGGGRGGRGGGGFTGRSGAGGPAPAAGPDLHELKGLVWQQLRAQVPAGERLEAGGAYFDLEDFVRGPAPPFSPPRPAGGPAGPAAHAPAVRRARIAVRTLRTCFRPSPRIAVRTLAAADLPPRPAPLRR